ncbi:MAG TPA: hypothetical protein VNO53_10040, partial [Steroidobacteraceae bacterium]|nr:hypothetical protein [Steroidobacteraceae bacterium]
MVGKPGAASPATSTPAKNCTTGPVRVLVISTMVWPDVVELPGSDRVLVESATPGVADRWATAFRAPARSSVEVRDRPRSSASAACSTASGTRGRLVSKGRATSSTTEPRIRLLGGFSVAVGDDVVADRAWRLRKAKALVKILALAPDRRVHRERLAEL